MRNLIQVGVVGAVVAMLFLLPQESEAQDCDDCYTVSNSGHDCHVHETWLGGPWNNEPVPLKEFEFDDCWDPPQGIPIYIKVWEGACYDIHGRCVEGAPAPASFVDMVRKEDLDGLRDALRISRDRFEYDGIRGVLRLKDCAGHALTEVAFNVLWASDLGLIGWFDVI